MVPRATYRLQLNRELTFAAAARAIPYLARLGISHLYASPLLKAKAGSMHGYDVTDHGMLNPELGTAEELEQLVATLREHGMGLIIDIVPNHLGVMGNDNQWWLDVLENGPAAQFANRFDIDWHPNRASMRHRLLVPVLGEPYGQALERGEIQLHFDAERGEFSLQYYEHRFPIDPREYPSVFTGHEASSLDELTAADFASLMNAFSRLPARDDMSEQARTERYRDKEAHKRRLVRLIEREPAVLRHIEEVVGAVNGTAGKPSSFDALDTLHQAQAYRLAFWRVASDEINYRRFFDVNSLAALRMNDADVFESTHWLIAQLAQNGRIDGVRIDHSDGLYDPERYFEMLRAQVAPAADPQGFYVVTEKILAPHERLPETWQVHGTTGYEFGALAVAWLIDGSGEASLTRIYRDFIEEVQSFEDIAYRSRRMIMRTSLAPEVEALATQLDRIAQLDRHTADFTRAALRDAIIETIAAFPVYRTYISERGVRDEDRRTVDWAISVARKRSIAADTSVYDFLRAVLLGEEAREPSETRRAAMLEFAMKFQQVTAPVTAKGVEDTALYRFNRLLCLNDVGSDPRRLGISAQAVHQENAERARRWPHAMLGTSTHDSKRSEDVRARIAVLSEMPEQWRRHLSRWSRLNKAKRLLVRDAPAPDRNDEYFIYQTLLGVWEPDADAGRQLERLQAHVVKAAREAKRITSWLNPDAQYEDALCTFVARLLERRRSNAFLDDFAAFAELVARYGRVNSLMLVVLKLTAPGVPDIYQGCESPQLTLVDPDNRAPVDFEAASRRLAELESRPDGLPGWRSTHPDETAKLWVTARLLRLRREHAQLFAEGRYVPLTVSGARANHVLAYARVHESHVVVVVLWRCTHAMTGDAPEIAVDELWGDTRIELGADCPSSRATDAVDGRTIDTIESESGMRSFRVSAILAMLPFAVLLAETEADGT